MHVAKLKSHYLKSPNKSLLKNISTFQMLECRVVVVVSGAGQEQSFQAFGERDANNQQNQSASGNIFYCTHNSSGEM